MILAGFSIPVLAQEADRATAPEFTSGGADSCIRCHDENSEFPVLDIFKTRHGLRGDRRSPFGQQQCESCHGPGGTHAGRVRTGQERPAIPFFGQQSPADVEQTNGICLNCHEKGHLAGWDGSVHSENQVACASCHSIHAEQDEMLDARLQSETCYGCHPKLRADTHKASSHPLRFGKMACSDCHQSHQSDNDHSLVKTTTNETCYTCHAEKRGPFLWEHSPVDEDCSNCHNAHGSNHPALLTRRSPMLCQQCHSRSGHPALSLNGDLLPAQGPTANVLPSLLLSRGCANCHSQVHGSNHPSGVNLTR
jgi:DmsE family decaheme c-type cytochrome